MGMTADSGEAECLNCQSKNVSKLVSRFARYRVEDDRIDEIADRLEMMGEPDSGSEMRSVLRELGKAGEEDVSAEIEEMFEADMEGKLDDLDE
jgi:hypothetical protein